MNNSKKRPAYLDYAAATPCDPRVIKEMVSCLEIGGAFANPHSKDHAYGWEAAEKVEEARARVASLVGASPLEITFTSGATEANNLAILGLAKALRIKGDKRRRVITSQIEHKAVLEACDELEQEGYEVVRLRPQRDGAISVSQVEEALDGDTFLVSIAQANSVLGTVSDVHAIAKAARERGAFFHTDTAQSAGYARTDFDASQISMATLTSEKICGPKGVGALYVQRAQSVPLRPLIMGGGQEKGLRGGTVPTHEVAGMGMAFEIMEKEGAQDARRIGDLRKRLEDALRPIPGCIVNGSSDHRVPGILSVSFQGIDGRRLLPELSLRVAASAGSACSSSDLKPSYVLTAIGLPDDLARASLRLSLGRFTTAQEVDEAAAAIRQAVDKLRI
ncbi:MAG: cysteine desulfurase family protein [Aeromonadales bacterium]|nr:cysteine desulfurase family protein [Aeromonadales bacterium]